MTRTNAASISVLLALALGLTACAAEGPAGDARATDATSETGDASAGAGSGAASPSGTLDAGGFAVPGQVVPLEIGDSVTYYSFPELSTDDAQTVTIHSVDYIEKSELGEDAPHDKFDTGVLLVSLTWESVKGSVQSNQGYLSAELDSGEHGIPLAFREDRLRNGRVPDGEAKTGTFTIALDRGPTTLTLLDYVDAPVAELRVDTSR